MSTPKVSIIVPIYNVEQYLPRCIDSIKNQTLEDIEIILVDDGSTDNSGKIVDEYAKTDNRIIAIHKENGGQASARNMGLEIARGDYIGFIDSDDWITDDMYELLYQSIKENKSDMSVCGRCTYSEEGQKITDIVLKEETLNLEEMSLQDYVVSKLFYSHTVVVWNKLYLRSIIEKHNIRFKSVNEVGSEDALFNYQVLCHIKKICAIDKVCYCQLSREDSTARTYKLGYMNRTANLVSVMDRYGRKICRIEKLKHVINLYIIFFFQWNMLQIKYHSKSNAFDLIKEELRSVGNNKIFRNLIKSIIFDLKIVKNMRLMGFRATGIIYIKIIFCFYYLKCYNIASYLTNR